MKLTQCRLCLQKTVRNLIRFVFYPRPPCSELFHAIFDSWPLYQSKNRINYRKTPFSVTKRSQKSYPNILYVFWFVTLKLWVVSLIFLTHVHFMKQKTEKRKIPFLLTKGVKNLIRYDFLICDAEIVGGFICYFRLIILLSSQKLKNVKYRFWLQKAIKNSILQIFLISDLQTLGWLILFWLKMISKI